MAYAHLTQDERHQIFVLVKAGCGQSAFAAFVVSHEKVLQPLNR